MMRCMGVSTDEPCPGSPCWAVTWFEPVGTSILNSVAPPELADTSRVLDTIPKNRHRLGFQRVTTIFRTSDLGSCL